MNDFWFAIYHSYSTSNYYDAKGLKKFAKDAKFASEHGVEYVILEDYYDKLTWGEYSNFWNEKNFRKIIKIIHDYGMKLLPYTDVTELATKGKIFEKYGKKWGAKNRWGKIYSGFISIYLPIAYPYIEYDFETKIMCPKSGWGEYYINQGKYLLENFEIDGIYMDRVDYRLTCHDHSNIKDHFKNGILQLVQKMDETVKNFDKRYITVMNDSCMNPDDTMTECIRSVDYVLSELLPVDWDPNAIPNRAINEFGDIIWKFRKFLRPILTIATEMQFQSTSMIDLRRINNIVKRLMQYKKPENIILFSHRKDIEGVRAIREITKKTGTKLGFFTVFKPLNSLEEALK